MNLTLSLISLIRKTAKGGMISLTWQADLEAYVVRHGGRHVQFRTQMWDVVLKFVTRDWRSLWLVSNCWQLNHARSIFHLEQVDTAYKKICNIKLWMPETSETLFIWRFLSINYFVFLVSLICVPLLLQEFLAGAHLAGGGGLVGGTQNDVENDVAEEKMHSSCRRLHLTGSVSLNFEVFLISGEVESQKYT